jgi:succinate dehydrogenase / fumarate reductase cytochrome b subunit
MIMTQGNRPLSPHLTIYRPQITSILSISHRITGCALAVGALVLAYWINAAAYGPEAFERMQDMLSHWFGRLLLFGWTFCLFYHLCNGIRHLCWDAGWGFDLPQVRMTGWLVVVASIALTLISWAAGYGMLG